MDLNILRAWIILKKHFLCWVLSCERRTLVHFSIFNVWEGRLGSMTVFHSLRLHLGSWEILGTVVD